MKVTVVTRTEEEMVYCDYRQALVVKVDGETVFGVRDDEPEDSNLDRSFSDCYKVDELMKMAYEAGKRGETFELEVTQSDDV